MKKYQYTKEDLDTDLDWFAGLGVSKKDATDYILHLVNATPDADIKKQIKRRE